MPDPIAMPDSAIDAHYLLEAEAESSVCVVLEFQHPVGIVTARQPIKIAG